VKKQEEIRISLRTQSSWLLAAKVVGFGFSFALPLLIVRYLSQDKVGVYRESFQVIMNAVVILPLGFSMSAYYFLSRDPERRSAAVLNILLFNFVVGGAACLTLNLFPQVLGSIFQTDEMTRLAPRIGVVIWIWIFSTFLETVAIANQEARAATFFIIFAQFSKALFMGAAVFLFGSVDAFLDAAIVQGVVQTAMLFWYLNSRFPRFWVSFSASFFRAHLVYATPFGLAGILWIAQNDIHNYFVGYKFSPSDYAIYAYGCFQVPLIAMLAESVTSVLLPRMNALQIEGNREEMIRLTARGMQKLAFFYFPIYAFLIVTAQTFVVTLFTDKYAASVPIFVINLTMLPFSVLITDPIVRAYKELGRMLLLTRIMVLLGLVCALYYGLGYFGLQGMITTAIGAMLIEKTITESLIIRKLGLGLRHLHYLKSVGKTAAVSLVAGLITYFVYANLRETIAANGEHYAQLIFSISKPGTLNFVGGAIVMAISAGVFAPVYLAGANLLHLIEDGDKDWARDAFRRMFPSRSSKTLAETRV
jgi:O-antigen/teichoic acid export membrane protein